MDEQSESPAEVENVSVHVSVQIPQLDAFRRQSPPGKGSQNGLWQFAAQLIDFGSALFAQYALVRPESRTRDLVMAALLRRGLITAESILTVLYRGLPEGAVPLVRTLIDIRLNATLVTNDTTEATAKKLAAYHYFAVQKHQQRMLTDRLTREMLEGLEGAREEAVDIARRNKAWFEGEGFDDIRGAIQPGKPWHGFSSAEDAFLAAGLNDDYYQTYDTGSLFTHAANIDFDFADIIDGRVMLKHPLHSDEHALLSILGVSLTHLYEVLKLYIGDKNIELPKGELTIGDGQPREVTSLEAIGFLLAQALPETVTKHKESPSPEA